MEGSLQFHLKENFSFKPNSKTFFIHFFTAVKKIKAIYSVKSAKETANFAMLTC